MNYRIVRYAKYLYAKSSIVLPVQICIKPHNTNFAAYLQILAALFAAHGTFLAEFGNL